MRRANLISFGAVSLLLVLWPAQSPARQPYGGPAKEYVLTVGSEELRFVPQGEKGYVVKQASRKAGISALAATLFLEQGRVQPIGGLDRHGVWIVENDGQASRNEDTIRSLRASGQVAYAAPLFLACARTSLPLQEQGSGDETVAVIPEIVVRVKPGTEIEQVQQLCRTARCTIKKRMEFTTQEYLLEVLGPDAEAVFAAVEELGQAPKVEWACPNTASRLRPAGEAVSTEKLSQNATCHSERSEESLISAGQTLRFAQGDSFEIASNARLYSQDSPQDALGGSAPSGVIPNDEYFPMQWHLHNTGQSGGTPGADIRAPEAWEITTGEPNIVIAVIDCGVDLNHPDLINNLVPGYDFYDNDYQPGPALDHPSNAHGTMCAGLIAAQGNNGIGVTGVTWNCKIMPIRLIHRMPNGTVAITTEADRATGFRWAANKRADILSNSWTWNVAAPIFHSALLDVTRDGGIGRGGKGCIVLFAADNQSGPVPYPTKYPEVIGVGATHHDDVRWYYSNYGPELDLVAPSGGLSYADWLPTKGMVWPWTTDISGPAGWNMDPFYPNILDYQPSVGTSGACPVAAGVAALILSIEPNLNSDEVRHFLERSAKDLGAPGRDDYYGWGRVDARAALDMVLAKRADLNNDWKVDFSDFAVFAKCWKTDDLRGDIGPIPRPDGVLDVRDLALMGEYWLKEIPELGLFAHWKLDETEGSIAQDSVGDKDGTLNGNPVWQPAGGKVNGALELDGLDDYVSTPFILDPAAGAFSIFAWIKGGKPGQVIVSQIGGMNWLLADATEGKLMTELTIAGRLGRPLSSQTIVTDDDWHRIGLTWDGSNRKLYVDDVEVAKDTQTSPAGSTGGLYIGAGKGLEAGSFWSGLIDDVKIYDRAVTP